MAVRYKNTQQAYGVVAIAIHWLSALVVLALFVVGLWMVDLDYYSEWYRTAPHYHKSVGLLLAFITVFRLGWKLTNPTPESLSTNEIEKKGASVAHLLIYGLLLGLFVSGYLISTADGRGIEVFNWFEVPALGELFADQETIAGDIHEYLAYALIALVVGHVLAALKHHYINKDNSLIRMIRTEK